MRILFGFVLLPCLMYLPGYMWSRWRSTDRLTQHYESVLASTLITGWLAFILAELGWFSLATLVGCVGGITVLGWLRTRRWPTETVPVQASIRWEGWLYFVILAGFALIVSRPFEIILGGRDAGVYPNTGYAIARNGGIVQYEDTLASIGQALQSTDPATRDVAAQTYSNFLGVQGRERFIATRYTQPGFYINEGDIAQGRVVPQFFHLYPTWIAIWTSLFGLYGGLMATGFLGWLAIWSVAMTARSMLGGRRGSLVGLIVLALLALNSLQIWFSRYSTSEALSQALLWAALGCWVRLTKTEPSQPYQRIWYGGLAGLAIGQLVLTRIDFFWGVGPFFAILVWAFIRRRWHRGYTALAISLGSLLLHGLLHISLIARSYFFDTGFAKFQDTSVIISRLTRPFFTPLLQEVWITNNRSAAIYFNTPRLWLEIVLISLAIAALVALRYKPAFINRLETFFLRLQSPLLTLTAISIVILAGYAYTIRPQIITAAMLQHPINTQLQWQGYIGAPIPVPDYGAQQQRAVVLANLVRFGWYISPLGIVLGIIGLAGLVLKDFQRSTWLVIVICLIYGSVYIRDTYGTADQTFIYIARRFIPATLPAFILGCSWSIASLIQYRQRIIRNIGFVTLTGLCFFSVITGWRSIRHVEYAGAITGMSELAQQFEPNAIILVRGGDRDTPSNIATPLRYTFNRDALVVWSSDPLPYRDFLAQQVAQWQQQGRPVYVMLGTNGGLFNLPYSYQDRGLFSLTLPEWQQLQNQKPFTAGPITLAYRIYQLAPAEPELTDIDTLSLTDYQRQLSGFYPVEQDQSGLTYAWTSAEARLLLPISAEDTTLELELGLGNALPPSLQAQPAQACLTLQAQQDPEQSIALPCLTITTKTPQTYTWQLPDTITSGLWECSLVTRTWIPNEYAEEFDTAPNDGRPLGLQWSGGQLLP